MCFLPTQIECKKTSQQHNIKRKRFQDVFPINFIKDRGCKTSPFDHSSKPQFNLLKRETREHLDTPIVSFSNDTHQQLTVSHELQTEQLYETNLLQKNQLKDTDTKKRQVFASEPAQIDEPPTSRHIQVPAPSGHTPDPKPVQNHPSQVKKLLRIVNHQNLVMSNLSFLWKNRKLCDAGISNGTSNVKVHKVVLSAICPKLLSAISTHLSSQEFLQVNFPQEVSTEALNAFAEYMYNGVLDLNWDILKQLKIIANRLEMKEFEQLCDSRLPKDFPPFTNAAKLPLTKMVSSVPAMSSSSLASYNPTPPATTQVLYVNKEITEAELEQVKMETDHMFGQESEVAFLAPNKSGNSADIVNCLKIKTEPVETGNDKYGYLKSSRSSNPVFTSTTSPLILSNTAMTASTSISSVQTSSTEFSIPFSQPTDIKSTELKPTHSHKSPLVSDLSPASCIGEPVGSQSSPINEDSLKQLNRQSIPTSSLQLPSTSTNNESIYPVRVYMADRRIPAPNNNKCKYVKEYETDLT